MTAPARGEEEIPPFEFLTVPDLYDRPAPPWLVGSNDGDGIIPLGQLTVLYGPSGHGKSFLALELAFCVASGIPWHGNRVAQGEVVYVVAEGTFGVPPRLYALERRYGLKESPASFHVVEKPVILPERAFVDRLLKDVRAHGIEPVLVVFDTLARCMAGHDENSAKSMGVVVDATGRIQRELKATVLLVHHTGKSGGDLRGSSSLRAAADKVMKLSRVNSSIVLESEKTKDGPEFESMRFRLEDVDVSDKWDKVRSAVLKRVEKDGALVRHPSESGAGPEPTPPEVWRPDRNDEVVLRVLARYPRGIAITALAKACENHDLPGVATLSYSTAHRTITKLAAMRKECPIRVLPGKSKRNRIFVLAPGWCDRWTDSDCSASAVAEGSKSS